MNAAGGSARLAMLRAAVIAVATWSFGAELASAPAAGQTGAKAPYRLGVFPYLPPVRIEEAYAPAAADFAKALDRESLHAPRLVRQQGLDQPPLRIGKINSRHPQSPTVWKLDSHSIVKGNPLL